MWYRIVAMVVGFCWVLLFLFVPETFWDRTPRPRDRSKKSSKNTFRLSIFSYRKHSRGLPKSGLANHVDESTMASNSTSRPRRPSLAHHTSGAPTRNLSVGFAPGNEDGVRQTRLDNCVRGAPAVEIDPIAGSSINPIGNI
jgi:hypothetical protein